jgi:hypothetical protein
MSDLVKEGLITAEDRQKLENLQDAGVPTNVLDNLFSMGDTNKTLFDALALLVGGNEPKRIGILQRTELNAKEIDIVCDALTIARSGLMADGVTKHPIPELEDRILDLLEARRSLERKSTNEFTDGLQKIKLKLSEIQNPIKSV